MRLTSKIQSRGVEFSCLGICLLFVLVLGSSANAQKQTTNQTKFANSTAAEGQAIYREYRGVRIGMTMEEARSKLGDPVFKSDDQDIFVFSQNETAQIAYNAARKVICISTDYLGGVGAPDYRSVVGAELEDRANGGKYKLVHYEREGFWVSYNRSGMTVPMVTITIQAELK